MAVPAGPGIQELDPVDVDEIPVVLGTRLFVVPRLRSLPALHINAGLCEAQNYEQQYVASHVWAGNSTKISSA